MSGTKRKARQRPYMAYKEASEQRKGLEAVLARLEAEGQEKTAAATRRKIAELTERMRSYRASWTRAGR